MNDELSCFIMIRGFLLVTLFQFYVFICLCTCVFEHVHTLPHGGQSMTSGVFLNCFPAYIFFRTVYLMEPEAHGFD